MPSHFALDYDGFVIGVHAQDAADGEWLLEFLEPQFGVTQGVRSDVEVSFETGSEAFAELEARSELAAGELYDAFVLDTSTLRFAKCALPGSQAEVRLALDTKRGVFFEVGPGPRVRVVGRDREFARIAWMRVVREFAMHALLRRGDLFLHAACFSVEGSGIVIAGVKGAGKTTTLTWCLQLLEKARFVANDRVHMRASGTGYEARGMPTVLTFRPASLALLPEFAAAVAASGENHRLSARERVARGAAVPPKVWDDGRIGMGPTGYTGLLARDAAASSNVAALVFPEVVAGSSGLQCDALTSSEAAGRLGGALFGAMDLHRRSQLFDRPSWGEFPSTAAIRARADRIAKTLPSYSWRVGSEAPQDLAALRKFLADIR